MNTNNLFYKEKLHFPQLNLGSEENGTILDFLRVSLMSGNRRGSQSCLLLNSVCVVWLKFIKTVLPYQDVMGKQGTFMSPAGGSGTPGSLHHAWEPSM